MQSTNRQATLTMLTTALGSVAEDITGATLISTYAIQQYVPLVNTEQSAQVYKTHCVSLALVCLEEHHLPQVVFLTMLIIVRGRVMLDFFNAADFA